MTKKKPLLRKLRKGVILEYRSTSSFNSIPEIHFKIITLKRTGQNCYEGRGEVPYASTGTKCDGCGRETWSGIVIDPGTSIYELFSYHPNFCATSKAFRRVSNVKDKTNIT